MRLIIAVLSLLAISATTATAQEYKCQNGGKVYLAQYPCPGNEYKEPTTPKSYVRAPDATPSAAEALANSPIVRQSNAMIAAALAERDFAKAERLAVTKAQWELIAEYRREAEARAEARALREAVERPTVCRGSSYNVGGYTESVQRCRKD